MSITMKICCILMTIGAINWGLIGLCNFDLVAFIFGPMTLLSRTIYTIVGIAGVWSIIECLMMSGSKRS